MPPRDRSGRPQEAVAGTATISGRVLDTDTGQPLRRATVQAFLTAAPTPGGNRSFVARTDETGAYTIREMPAGVYTLRAQRGGYVEQTLGQTNPNSLPRRLTLEDRTRLSGIDFKLQPGGVIAGRVTDDLGEPAEGVFMRVLRARPWRGKMRYLPAGGRMAPTDDLGNFRIYGLAPGEYILAADPGGGRMMGPAVTSDAQGVDTVTTYAPGTPAPGEAERITVVAGQVTPMDVQLIAARVVTVSGRVVDSTGKPLDMGMVNLRPADAEVMTGGISGRSIMQGGAFSVTGVTPGAYTLHVMASPRQAIAGPDALAQMESAELPLVVGSSDIEQLTVTTSPPSSVTGRIIIEGNASTLQPSAMRVFARPVDPEPMMFGPQGQGPVQDDYTVAIPGVRGLQTLFVNGLPRGWWVKSVRVNGQNATDGFDFGSGRTWTGLEIVVNDRPSSVGGQVTAADGKPAADYVVLAFPQDYESRANLRLPGLSGLGTPDQNGGFVIENLRPGEYYVVAVESGAVDFAVLDDPDRLRELSQRAQQVTVGEGDLQFLNLKL
jgi:protocatechuate 3,4-dioxygenase beta subunit